MSIVAVEVVSDTGTAPREVRFRVQDSSGAWHDYGPVFTNPQWDAEAFKPLLAAKVAAQLAQREFEQALG